jgi:hypothetical protein
MSRLALSPKGYPYNGSVSFRLSNQNSWNLNKFYPRDISGTCLAAILISQRVDIRSFIIVV